MKLTDVNASSSNPYRSRRSHEHENHNTQNSKAGKELASTMNQQRVGNAGRLSDIDGNCHYEDDSVHAQSNRQTRRKLNDHSACHNRP